MLKTKGQWTLGHLVLKGLKVEMAMLHNFLKKSGFIYAIVTLALVMSGCSTKGTIIAEPKAELTRLNSGFTIVEKVGETPIPITDQANIARYGIKRKGAFTEYLIVLYPQKVDGEIKINEIKIKGANALANAYREYLDRVLRCHRLILEARLDEAKELLKKLKTDYDDTFGGLYLSGLINVIEGDHESARRNMSLAKAIFPEAKELQEINKN